MVLGMDGAGYGWCWVWMVLGMDGAGPVSRDLLNNNVTYNPGRANSVRKV
jgi:hypothetical protein